ncbi:MAG: hypothetical protein H7A06_05575 [Pseudomonadales bacterium]|nr:hypothetical protein [Pseudomonadales bacterium]
MKAWTGTTQVALIGPGLVSSMLLALKAADTPLVRAVVADELKDNAAVSQKSRIRTLGGLTVQTLDITVSDNASTKITVELSDLGPFTMVSQVRVP